MNLKWRAYSRWSFHPNPAWDSIGTTTTIRKTHHTLRYSTWIFIVKRWYHCHRPDNAKNEKKTTYYLALVLTKTLITAKIERFIRLSTVSRNLFQKCMEANPISWCRYCCKKQNRFWSKNRLWWKCFLAVDIGMATHSTFEFNSSVIGSWTVNYSIITVIYTAVIFIKLDHS